MRMGFNRLIGPVGLDPSNGDVYIFVGLSRKLMKILHWEYRGYVLYYKRLEQGRFHPKKFLRQGVGFRPMRWSELVLLMEGISPKAARRHRYDHDVEPSDNHCGNVQNSIQKSWLYRYFYVF